MSDVDGLLASLKCFRFNKYDSDEACQEMRVSLHRRLEDIIATIEQQRTEIERLRSQLSPRCSIPADMELDDAIVRFTNRTDEPC